MVRSLKYCGASVVGVITEISGLKYENVGRGPESLCPSTVTVTAIPTPVPLGTMQVNLVSDVHVGAVHAEEPAEMAIPGGRVTPKLLPSKVIVLSASVPSGGNRLGLAPVTRGLS